MPPMGTEGGLIQTLNDSAIGTLVRESETLFPWLESIHVLAIVVVVGTIVMVDLRLIGFSAHRRSARQLILEMLPFTWVAFVVAVVTGILMFLSNATGYFESFPFRIKLLSILFAGINMAIFHSTAFRRIGDWDDQLPPPNAARIAGFSSLGLWILIIFLGRWIGYAYPLV